MLKADAQTAANQTESKLQTRKTQSSSFKVMRLNDLTSAVAALSPIAVFDFEISL